jgi:hypothetical protein
MTSHNTYPGNWLDAERRRVGEIMIAGTDDLLQEAVRRARDAIPSVDAGLGFIVQYKEISAYRGSHDGEFPDTTYPPIKSLVSAIDELKDARTQNLMADPGLRAGFGGDRQAVAHSYLMEGTVIEVLDKALEAPATPQE